MSKHSGFLNLLKNRESSLLRIKGGAKGTNDNLRYITKCELGEVQGIIHKYESYFSEELENDDSDSSTLGKGFGEVRLELLSFEDLSILSQELEDSMVAAYKDSFEGAVYHLEFNVDEDSIDLDVAIENHLDVIEWLSRESRKKLKNCHERNIKVILNINNEEGNCDVCRDLLYRISNNGLNLVFSISATSVFN